ncbi:MAG: AI-2E family transporter [Anaerolineaceae bacterium]|nr:AI-2E family transporter [Anaerolineaceae bacterium]
MGPIDVTPLLPPSISSPPWTGRTKRIVGFLAAGAVLLAVFRLSELLPIVSVSIILAYLLTPLVNFIDNRVLAVGPLKQRSHRGIAVGFTYLVILAVVIIVILVVVPVLVAQFEEFGRRVPALLRDVEQKLEISLNEPVTFNGEPILINNEPFIPLQRLQQATGMKHVTDIINLSDFDPVRTTQSFVQSLTGPAFDVVGGALTAVINLIFLLSVMFFLMRDGAIFADRGVQLLPNSYQGDARRLLFELGQVWNAYLRGQLTLAFFMGIVVFTIATIIGMPNPIILGMISMILEFIPSIGSGLAIFPAGLLALTAQSTTVPGLQGGAFALMVVIIWAVLQNIEAYILVPRVMGGSLNLHPIAVILGIIAGANLAGVLGIILAAPTVASLRIFGQYIYGKLMDRDPFPTIVRRRNKSLFDDFSRRIRSTGVETRISPQIREWLGVRRN